MRVEAGEPRTLGFDRRPDPLECLERTLPGGGYSDRVAGDELELRAPG